MGSLNLDRAEGAGAQKILCLLDALRGSQTGSAIYRQVERMLDDVVSSRQTAERAYIALINQLLDAYLAHLRGGSPLQVQIRLLKARLQPPLTAADLAALADYVERYSGQIEALQQLDVGLVEDAVGPLLQSFGIIDTPALKPEPRVAPVAEDIAAPESPAEVQPARAARPEPEPLYESEPEPEPPAAVEALQPEQAQTEPQTAEEIQPPPMPEGMVTGTPIRGESAGAEIGHVSETQVDTAYRSHLDSKRRDIQKLQATLAKQVLETIAQNEEFGVLLEVVLGELRQAGDGREMEDLRWTLIREIEKLTKGHHELAEKLDSTHHYLQLIESDSRQLSDELTRVRLLSLTDELTGLPNRRAFLRRIEDEVARVQRYGFPLSLALIDLDHFKQINDKHGHAGGDEVLQIYSKNILSIFRHHDLVARYGGEEFAVLLPNTDAEGSMRALTKVRNRALETRWQANGEMIPVPTFSAGVSLYKPGETASAFIERADKALYRAKRLGRNRVEEDATYKEPETPGKEPERKQRGES
ncbi:MAG: GGDEF domain-containing protein [Gammaproteobacteria bacterium]|nr:MAG: GGDEF domain-containing protein [Gammaproteobacteria bacterium]